MDKIDELIARSNMLPSTFDNLDILQALYILHESFDHINDIWDNMTTAIEEQQKRQYNAAMSGIYT